MYVRALMPLALVLAAGGAQAQKIAPGLWEMTMNTKVGGAEMQANIARMQEQMAKMPPEQRKMMEEMMAKQGVSLVGGGAAPGAIRYCVSKEQAERGEVPQDPDGRCKRDSMERSGSTMRFKFSCTNPPSSGTGEFTFASDKAYTMKMAVDTTVQGKPQRMEMQQNGKWVAADCGGLKPRP